MLSTSLRDLPHLHRPKLHQLGLQHQPRHLHQWLSRQNHKPHHNRQGSQSPQHSRVPSRSPKLSHPHPRRSRPLRNQPTRKLWQQLSVDRHPQGPVRHHGPTAHVTPQRQRPNLKLSRRLQLTSQPNPWPSRRRSRDAHGESKPWECRLAESLPLSQWPPSFRRPTRSSHPIDGVRAGDRG